MMHTMRRYLAWIGRHQPAVAVIASVAAAASLVLNPGDAWAWIVAGLAAAWLAVIVIKHRGGTP